MNIDADTDDFSAADTYGDELPNGTRLLQGQYEISQYLNAGGFGITYLAQDSLDRRVVIKECFPSAMCCRRNRSVRVRSAGNEDDFASIVKFFGQEARALAKLKHPNIVGVHQVFEDNNTSYMALDFVQGRDLLDIIEQEPGRLMPSDVKRILMRLLSAVGYIHDRGILHRDISPDNILLDADNNPVLIDFGAAREEASRVSRLVTQQATVKDGYSPQEFYISGAKQTPASDLYALAATFYHLIAGEAPPVSQLRLSTVAEGSRDPYMPLHGSTRDYDEYFLKAIDKCLEVFPKDRILSAQEWLVEIDTERRRLAALERADDDMDMQAAISKLVVETNKVVSSGADVAVPERKERTSGRALTQPVEKQTSPSWEKFKDLNDDAAVGDTADAVETSGADGADVSDNASGDQPQSKRRKSVLSWISRPKSRDLNADADVGDAADVEEDDQDQEVFELSGENPVDVEDDDHLEQTIGKKPKRRFGFFAWLFGFRKRKTEGDADSGDTA